MWPHHMIPKPKPDVTFLRESNFAPLTFTTTFLHRHKAICIEMTEILRFDANMTEETLFASARLLVYAFDRKPLTDPG